MIFGQRLLINYAFNGFRLSHMPPADAPPLFSCTPSKAALLPSPIDNGNFKS